ncbi:hypothetical protein SHI21_19895 [Bacteriovorax sp. PP10]|uniref:PIN domain-containing protein n=1 Tax=Bacteriovorax antarcticus TaxID=3088717 RepID=A0ABU5VZK7_9BACT|nr:hypothetical protein [Bacteriovorax sp. PP10]MEA9358509.1 hypothetical protein [Bacteriovorax sp. PP10]
MIRPFSELSNFIKKEKSIGCFVDTTVLFSATYPLDSFNTESELIFNIISRSNVLPYTNVNVRAEFLENHRRVLIAECLIDFLEDFNTELNGTLLEKLKLHRTSYRRKVVEEKSIKIDIGQIKRFRQLLSAFDWDKGDGWDLFCKDYLNARLKPIWTSTKEVFDLNFISIRTNNENDLMLTVPQWEEAVSLMGSYGIASNDAMILNMFLCSKIPILLTTDLEMAEVASKTSNGTKRIFVPDALLTTVH